MSYFMASIKTKLPNKPLRNDQFLKTVQKNNLVADADCAGRLYVLLVDNRPGTSDRDCNLV